MLACLRACVLACLRACVLACLRACVLAVHPVWSNLLLLFVRLLDGVPSSSQDQLALFWLVPPGHIPWSVWLSSFSNPSGLPSRGSDTPVNAM